MKPLATLASAMTLLLALAMQPATAQQLQPATGSQPVASARAPLQPFVASYQVYNAGRLLGEATMQVLPAGDGRWRIDLVMKGAGLMRITGLNLQQSTVFDAVDDQFRPLSQSTVQRVFLSNRKTVGVYDWRTGTARWTGDIKESRRSAVKLSPGDMSGLLINLAVIRDAAPGKQLDYHYVDTGRVRDHVYQVANDTEQVAVDDISYDAMRVSRVHGNDETTLWVASGVPTPIRIVQRDGGKETYDLRLVQYTGA